MSIQFAPTELLHQIFLHLPKSSLLKCAMVCQSWNLPALQLLYENVELSEKTKMAWLHMVQAPTAINVGIFVRKLTISLAFSTTLSEGEFLKVISCLPFIKSIDIKASGYKLHYLAYLNKRDASCVTYLEDIYTGDLFTNYQIQQYFLCAYSFRHTLKFLTLKNPNAVYQMNGQTKSALFLLNQFTNLTHLTIIDDMYLGEDEAAVFMDAILSCSKLVSFAYQNNHLLPYSLKNSPKAKKIRSMKNTKLQTVALNVSDLTSIYMTHVLFFFPTNMDMLSINMVDTDYHKWIQENAEIFASYFGRVKKLKMSITNTNTRRGFMVRKSQRNQNASSKFGEFICSVTETRQVHVHITFVKSGSRPDIVIEKDQHKLLLSYIVENMVDFCACLDELSLIYISSTSFNHTIINSFIAEIPSIGKGEFDYSRCMEIIKSIALLPYLPKTVTIMCPKTNTDEGRLIQSESRMSFNMGALTESTKLNYVLFKNIGRKTLSIQAIADVLSIIETLELCLSKTESKDRVNGTYIIEIDNIKHLDQLVLDVSLWDNDPALITVQMAKTKCLNLQIGRKQDTTSDSDLTTLDIPKYSNVIIIKCPRIEKLLCIRADEKILFATLMSSSITA